MKYTIVFNPSALRRAGVWSVLALGVFAPMFASAQMTNCVAPPGLVSWWRGEGNANDSVGSNHGALRGGTGFGPGRVGQAFAFDGVDDWVFVPDSASLRLTGALTFE